MSDSAVVHRALDGSRIALGKSAGSTLNLSMPFTSVVRLNIAGRMYELITGSISFGNAWAQELGVTPFNVEFTLQDGRLKIGQGTQLDSSVQHFTRDTSKWLQMHLLGAVWEGAKHSLGIHVYEGDSTPNPKCVSGYLNH